MIVDSALYRDGSRVAGDDECRVLRSHATEPGDFVWVGLSEPTEVEMHEVASVFDLHPLAVEDAVKAHQRPKLERYESMVFVVLKTLWYVEAEDAVETGEIALFIGQDFVVSVRHGQGTELHPARVQLESAPKVLRHGPGGVVYTVLDHVVDGYLAVGDELALDVDEIEGSVFSTERTNDAARIYTLKRELAEVRRAVLPLRDPLNRLSSGAVPGVSEEAGPFFRDVADHLARVSEMVESLDGLLSTAFDAHLAQVAVQQNSDMRKISAAVGLVAAPTIVASVYGMNFHNMPGLGTDYGYPIALLMMAAISGGLWAWFKRSGWL
ncbi:MAG: magnesium/cobalt transporter CorA [Nocardioides sp.]